ncbi:MAG TPA: hypothetical protein VHS59_02415 [Bacillota bacterium]|nr:hypothetical protein [Bacillota bacterium]
MAGIPAEKQLDRLRQGIQLEDGLTAPARVKLLKAQKQHAWLELTIHEGRNRQVRRMCDAIGFPVIYLARVGMGFLSLEGLPLGSYRLLTAGEVQQLKALAGLGS